MTVVGSVVARQIAAGFGGRDDVVRGNPVLTVGQGQVDDYRARVLEQCDLVEHGATNRILDSVGF